MHVACTDTYLGCFFVIDDARAKFKEYVNILAQTRPDGKKKVLVLKPKYRDSGLQTFVSTASSPPSYQRTSLDVSISPSSHCSEVNLFTSVTPRQPPPYRPPPPPITSSTDNFDNVSFNSLNPSYSILPNTPQIPPRRKSVEKGTVSEESRRLPNDEAYREGSCEKQTMSVKERMQKFNRMASVEDERSPNMKQQKGKHSLEKVGVFNF